MPQLTNGQSPMERKLDGQNINEKGIEQDRDISEVRGVDQECGGKMMVTGEQSRNGVRI